MTDFTPEQIEKMGESAWLSLSEYSEVKHITEPGPFRGDDGNDPYKPFYRTATILVAYDPPHFKVLGLRRHLTAVEAIQIARAMHPYMVKHLSNHDGQRHFLQLFHDFAEMYNPKDWK